MKAPSKALLASWTPVFIYGAGLIILLIAAKRFFDFLPDKSGGEQAKEGEEQEQRDIITGSDFNPDNLTRPRGFYFAIAQRQYNAMNQWGTDVNEIFASLEGLNKDELNAVYQAFGLRASTVFWRSYAISERKNLLEWYRAELNNNKLAEMQTIWAETNLWN